MKSFIASLKSDFQVILRGFFFSIPALLLLSLMRLLSPQNFLFKQILWVTLILYLLLLIPQVTEKLKVERQRVVLALIVFSILSTLLLNIDRSRSVFVLKWTSEVSKSGLATPESIVSYKGFEPSYIEPIRQRLDEQRQLGTVSQDMSGYRLTLFGKVILKISHAISILSSLDGFRKA
jgi:hypothetical protein